mmetsp:Transcript_14098/g.34765  ORF Transcript_14098/g.34765 Transcript_14098/m.34765 type:complete len:215 (-) Transcript_14098:9-653(-)
MSLADQSPKRTSVPPSSSARMRPHSSYSSSWSFFRPRERSLSIASITPLMRSMSLSRSSEWMISRSATGSTRSSTWITSASSNALHTWKMPSTEEMCDRNALPRPSPLDAPLTRPAMSQISRYADTADLGLYRSHSHLKRSSGTLTRAWLGSMVQKGKFSAGMPILLIVLNRVDFPTFGRPTIPILRFLLKRPRRGRSFSSSFFLGAIVPPSEP